MSEPTRERREKAARVLYEQGDFPNCVGSIDERHVTLKCPKNSGSQYFSYLQTFSLEFMTTVGPDYKFICAHIGGHCENCEWSTFEHPVMGEKFETGTLNDPQYKPLHSTRTRRDNTTCVDGDQAFQ